MPPFSLSLRPDEQAPQSIGDTSGVLDQIQATTKAKTTPAPTEAGQPDLTDFLNREMLSKGGPIHPATGVFMGGAFRGMTPDQVREKLIAQHGKAGGGALQTGGLATGGLSAGGMAKGGLQTAGGMGEANWRKIFPSAPGSNNVTVDPTNGLKDPVAAKPPVPGSTAGATTMGNAQARSLVEKHGFGFASISPANRPVQAPQSPAGVRPNLYIGDETGNRTAEFAQSLPKTKGESGFKTGIGTAPKADIRPFSPARTPKPNELVA